MEVRTCAECALEKPASDFGFSGVVRPRYTSYCGPCRRLRLKRYRANMAPEHRARVLERKKEYHLRSSEYELRYRLQTVERAMVSSKKSYERNKVVVNARATARKFTKFGLSTQQVDQMVMDHDNKCAICHRPETRRVRGKVTALNIDHNHETNQVRGLLCHACNVSLGLVRESRTVLLAMVDYLNKYGG